MPTTDQALTNGELITLLHKTKEICHILPDELCAVKRETLIKLIDAYCKVQTELFDALASFNDGEG